MREGPFSLMVEDAEKSLAALGFGMPAICTKKCTHTTALYDNFIYLSYAHTKIGFILSLSA